MEKPELVAPSDGSLLSTNSIVRSLSSAYEAFQSRRAALGLSNPGNVDGVAREVQRDVFLNNLMFSGFRVDLTRGFSQSPVFQTGHNFTMGTQGLPPYSFTALYGSPSIFFQGTVDNDLHMSIRANYRWTSALVSKATVQLAPGGGQSMVQLEGDYTGADFSANIKAINPSAIDGPLIGTYVGDYLQSITPSLSLGVEAMFQRTSLEEGPVTMLAYVARYKGPDWVASGQLLANGAVATSYWKRLTERIEAGADLNLQFAGLSGAPGPPGGMMGSLGNDGLGTFGVKYDFRTSSLRGQIDSKGKVSCLMEKQVAQPISITFAGELDHAKIGLAISVSAANEELIEQQERMQHQEVVTPPF